MKARYDKTVSKGEANISPFRAVPVHGFHIRPSCRALPPNLSRGGSPETVDVPELNTDPLLYRKILRDERISHGAYRLWQLLREMANKDNECWPGQRYIGRTIHCDAHSVKKWITELISGGYIVRHPGGPHRSTRYHVFPNSDGVEEYEAFQRHQEGCVKGHTDCVKNPNANCVKTHNLIKSSKCTPLTQVSITDKFLLWEAIRKGVEELKSKGAKA